VPAGDALIYLVGRAKLTQQVPFAASSKHPSLICHNQLMSTSPAKMAKRFEPDRCANCFEPLPATHEHRPWLFCSVPCRETANTVRYWRKTSRNGKFEADPEVRLAIGIRLAHMLAGGYNANARRIPLAIRALVIERDRACVMCAGPGEEIDHIDGDSNEPENLQLLCKTCHHSKTAEHLVPASDEQADRVFAMLVYRVVPDTPAQLCDDEVAWQAIERQLRSERLARVRPDPIRRKDELASVEMLHPGMAPSPAADFDQDDDDDDRGEDYYAGFGENSHYMDN
jgi:hypothetical protein